MVVYSLGTPRGGGAIQITPAYSVEYGVMKVGYLNVVLLP